MAGLILNPNYGRPEDVLPLAQVRRDDPPACQRLPAVARAEAFNR
jgi:hypothetical protein